MLHTTFAKLKEEGACKESYRKLAKALGGSGKYGENTPMGLDKVLEVCGLEDALWCLRAVIEPAEKEIRLFACDCAERVLPLFEKEYPNDKRPRRVIEIVRKSTNNQATDEELAASVAARNAASSADSGAAGDAAWAAWAASMAVRTPGNADWASMVASVAARATGAASVAARDAERDWQKERLLEILKAE